MRNCIGLSGLFRLFGLDRLDGLLGLLEFIGLYPTSFDIHHSSIPLFQYPDWGVPAWP
jgi:hypothetical protein